MQIARNGVTETYLAACPYFATEKWEFDGPVTAASSHEHFDLLVFLEGGGRIQWTDGTAGTADYARAQSWLIPAALGAYEIAPKSRTSLLRTYQPADMDEFVRRLEERGVDRSRWSKLIYT